MAGTASVDDGAAEPPSAQVQEPQSPESTHDGKGRWLVLAAVVFGLFMPMLDNLVVNVALPAIQRELAAQVSDTQWIIDAYILTFAAYMLIGGSLGDVFGRKKLFLGGMVLFTAASLACGLSQSIEQLIAFRALQGLGAALVVPGSLSILTATFHGGQRGTAIGIWAAMSGLAVAVGPLVGGYLVERYSWETIFFINIPIGIVSLLLTAIGAGETRDTSRARRVDLPGLITGTAGLLFLVYGLVEGRVEGWTDAVTLGSFAASAILLLLFIVSESKSKNPMLPLRFFRNPTFAAANVVAASVFFALFGTTFFLALYLQNVRGYSPLETGIRLIPFTAAILLISPMAGKMSGKHGSRWFLTTGCLYAAGGMALLLRVQPASSYTDIILPALVVLGAGMALTLAPMTTAVMGAADPPYAGVASATTNTARELGGVLGIALLGALVTSTFRDRLLENLTGAGIASPAVRSIVDRASGNAAAAGGTLDAIRQQVPAGTPDAVVDQVVTAARNSFVDAISAGMLLGVGFLLLAALVAAIFVRSDIGQEHPAVEPEQQTEGDRWDEVRVGLPDPLPPAPVPAAEPESVKDSDQEPSTPVPDGRSEKRKSASLTPVSVADTHFHHKPAAGGAWEPEEEAAGATIASDSYYHLRGLMVDLPIKAGTGEVAQNLEEVALATLSYYQFGLSQPGGDALPVGVANGAQSSTREDISILAGYLDLEKRLGRVNESVSSEQAATHLMVALASRALKVGAAGIAGNRRFVLETVNACLQGSAPSPVDASSEDRTADSPAEEPAEGPTRLAYRRRGRTKGPDA